VMDQEEEEEYNQLMEDGFTDDQLKLLYMIALYSHQAETVEDAEKWIRHMPLTVMMFECIVEQAFDYDYAPMSVVNGGRRMYMNITQEGIDDLDDLRTQECINSIKLTTKDFSNITAYQCSDVGLAILDSVPGTLRREIDRVLFDESNELREAFWNGDNWVVRSRAETKVSEVTEADDVSYVSSAYLPAALRHDGQPCSSNAKRAKEARLGVITVDDEVDEVITLDEVSLLIGEWIPMGSNVMVKLNENMGSTERCQGGFLTQEDTSDMAAEGPLENLEAGGDVPPPAPAVSPGLTEMRILDYKEARFLNFEATIHFPEEPGIVQIESFGIHAECDGTILYGLHVDAIMERIKDKLSVDYLCRVLVDIQQDSSKIFQTVLTKYQTQLMDLMFAGYAQNRDKFNLIFAERIHPAVKAEEYYDGEDRENELRQVLGITDFAADLGEDEVVLMGHHGCILAGPNCRRHESTLVCFLSLRSRDLFMRNFFVRMNSVQHMLEMLQDRVNNVEKSPDAIAWINDNMSVVSRDISILDEALVYMLESLDLLLVPPPPSDDDAAVKLVKKLDIPGELTDLEFRVHDMRKNIQGIVSQMKGLRGNMKVIAEKNQFRIGEAMAANTKSMEQMFRSAEKGGAALEVMTVILAGTICFQTLERVSGEWTILKEWWAIENLQAAIIDKPFAWFAVSLLLWGLIGYIVNYILESLANSENQLIVAFNVNIRVDMINLATYLHVVEVLDEEFSFEEGKHTWRRVQWYETNILKWEGNPPKVEMVIDWTYGWMLRCMITYNRSQGKMNRKEIKVAFFDELKEALIIDKHLDLSFVIDAHDVKGDDKRDPAFKAMLFDDDTIETPRYTRGSTRASTRGSSRGSRGSSRKSSRGSTRGGSTRGGSKKGSTVGGTRSSFG